MSYTPEISEITVVSETNDEIVVMRWLDAESICIESKSLVTNAKDWPEISAAIEAGLNAMERSTQQYQQKVNG